MTVIGIVGAGAVGQATAVALSTARLATELVVVSRTRDQAAALATDVHDQCITLAWPCRIHPGTATDLQSCDIVVIAVRAPFHNTRTHAIRMAGLHANTTLITQLGTHLRGHTGVILVLTNPVDLMSRLLADTAQPCRVYGIGSALDSARYRAILAHHLTVPVTTITGHVIGEHGDAAVICASSTTVNGQPLTLNLNHVQTQLHARPETIRSGIGRVRAGPAGATVSALHKILGLTDGIEELSTLYQDGWLGVPLRFTRGQPELAMPILNPHEAHQFADAHAKLRHLYDTLHQHTTPEPKEHP